MKKISSYFCIQIIVFTALICTSCELEYTPMNSDPFRVALSLSPFALNQFEDGYSFVVGDKTATTPAELQAIYRDLGSTEMFVRIATKRHKTYKEDGVTLDNTVDGKEDENANVHTFDQAIELCKIAAGLDIPINPEIMGAYTYMDMDKQQEPRFEEYPEIYALQNGKKWSDLSVDEACTVMEAYGAFVAEELLSTGCTINNWNLGNEANFGFAATGKGISDIKKYTGSVFSVWWLKENIWKDEARVLAATKKGVLSAYDKLGIDSANVKFSTHIATVVSTPRATVSFFKTLAENGYKVDVAGISYYPSASSMAVDRWDMLTRTVVRINHELGVPVFIAEFAYPSGKMEGPFAGWNKKLKSYKHNQHGQAEIYADVIEWGREYGLAGIRYWAPDYEKWYAMSMFEFADKKGTAKEILLNHKELIGGSDETENEGE